MSHTHSDSDNQTDLTHDDSLSDVNIKVRRFYLSHLSEDDQKGGILITAETDAEKSTIEKRISLELEHPDHFGLILLNYKGPESDDYFPLNSTVKVKEIVLDTTITERDDLKDRLKNIFRDDIKYIITKKGNDCRYLCKKVIKYEQIVIRQMELEIIDTNNSFRRFAFYLNDGSSILLCRAIRNKNIGVIEILLNLKFNINARNEAGWIPLHVAVDLKMSDVVDLLISNGANINATNRQGQVPLHISAKKSNLKILDSLLRNQVNLNARDINGRTPLFYAVDARNVKVVDILLKKGADYKLEDRWGHTPFHLAAIPANLDMMKVFLDNNADPNIVDSRKQTPLYAIGKTTFIKTSLEIKAADKDTYLKTINALLKKGANINFQDFTGNTPLHRAVMDKDSALIQALLECNADPAIKNDYGDNVLHLASQSGQADNCVQDILDSNIDIDAVNSYGDTALHIAIQRNDYNIVKLILKKNPNIDIKNIIGYTALHKAVKFNHCHIVDLLLENRANVDLQDADGKTALHLAIESYRRDIIMLLLENKANVNLKDLLGRTALLLAANLTQIPIEIIESILNSSDDIDAKDKRGRTALHYAALNTDNRTLKLLLKAKADVNVKDSEGNTPLHLTMTWENGCAPRFEFMQLLVNCQADVNAVDNDMRTPLHHACWNKNVEAVEYLLKNGADCSMRDRDGRTVFHYVCMIKKDIHHVTKKDLRDIVNILIEEDVSVNCVDKSGKTPLHYVFEGGEYWHLNLHKQLLEIGADINIENENHKTVFDQFIEKTNLSRFSLYSISSVELYQQHVIKMKEMGMWVCEKTLDKFNKVNNQYELQNIQLYERECRKEVDLMNTNIDQSNITYYNFLKKRAHKSVNYTRNQNVVNAIKSDELLAIFPIYGHFLKSHLRELQQRCNLYEKIQRFSKSNIFKRFPTDCMNEIFQCLNNSDLDNFLQALKPVVLIK